MNKTEDTIDYYNKNKKQYISSTLNLNMVTLYKPFLELLKPGAKILDAGCGPGRDVKHFHDLGFEVVGFDASEEMVKKAVEVTGLPILRLDFNDMKFENEFDAIWACASLLHVPKNKILEILFKFSKALKIDGVFYLSFKYGNVEEIRNGRLFSNYTEETLSNLISKINEFIIIQTWKTADIRPDRKDENWLNALINKR